MVHKNIGDYIVFICMIFTVLTGCAVRIPAPLEPVVLEEAPQWNVADYKLIFGSLFTAQQNVGMQKFIGEVLAHNPDLKSLASTVKATRYNAHIAKAEIWPQAGFNVSGRREKNALTKEMDKTVSISFEVSWALDIWGKLLDDARSAQYLSEKSEYDLSQAKRVMVAQSVNLWVEYLNDIRIENDLTNLNAIFNNILDYYEESYQTGLSPFEFYLNAKNNLKNGQTRIRQVQLERIKTGLTMNIMRGHFPAGKLVIKESRIPITLMALPDSISPTSLAERPDIRSAFAQTRGFEFSARAAYKALLPQINLTVSAFKNGETLKKAFNGDLLWQLVGGLTQPLFNGGQLRAIARQKSAEAEASWWQYRNTVLKAMLEVEQAMADDKMLARRIGQKKTMLKDMEKKTASAKERFSDGDMALPDYLQIKAERIEAQMELSGIELLYIKNRLSLVMALGLPVETMSENKNEKS